MKIFTKIQNSKKSIALVGFATILSFASPSCDSEPTLMQKAEKLQRSILTIDTHSDTPMQLWRRGMDLTKHNETGCVDFPRMKEGSLDVESFAVFTWQGGRDSAYVNKTYDKALKTFDMVQELAAKNPDIVGIALTPEDMYRLKKEGKSVIFPTIENSLPIGTDLSRIETLYNKGARMFGLVHSYNNDIADSSSDPKGPEFGGLSKFGEEVVAELNRIGAIIDVSHASDEAFYDVVRLSKTPIVASHSSVRAVANHDRNFNDDMLKTLKENGGVIQICILDKYVKNIPTNKEFDEKMSKVKKLYNSTPKEQVAKRDSIKEVMAQLKLEYPDQLVTVKDYVDHIDYVAKFIGVDYVGIGTDFDGGGGVSDCMDVSQLIKITAELMDRGYSKEDIEKIWGGNFLRVFNKVIEYKNSLSCE